MKRYRYILRDPLPAEGGGGASTQTEPKSSPAPAQKMVRVDLPKQAPKEVLSQTFSVEDFDVAQLPTSAPTKIEDTKTGEVTLAKESAAIEEPPIKKEPEKKETPPVLQPPAKKDAPKGKEKIIPISPVAAKGERIQRDYTGHSTEEVEVFKKMSDEGYQFTKQLLQKNKELSKLEGATYLQHDMAYILNPEYQTLKTDVHYLNGESEHWKQQLLLMKQGKPIHDIKGWSKDGRIVMGGEHQPTAELEEEVRKRMYACDTQIQQRSTALQEYPTKFQTQIKQDRALIEQEMKSRFSWENDPALMDYELPIDYEDGTKNVSIKQIREDFLLLLPSYERHSVGARVAANLMVALRIGHAEIASMKAGGQVQQTLKEEVTKAEPTTKVGAAKDDKKKVNGVTEFSGEPV